MVPSQLLPLFHLVSFLSLLKDLYILSLDHGAQLEVVQPGGGKKIQNINMKPAVRFPVIKN